MSPKTIPKETNTPMKLNFFFGVKMMTTTKTSDILF